LSATDSRANCVSVQDKVGESAYVRINNLNLTSTPDSVGGSRSNCGQEPSSYNVLKCFCKTTMFCQLPVRIDERGGCWRRGAEFGDVVQLTVTQGCVVSPCGIRETRIVLECSTVGSRALSFSGPLLSLSVDVRLSVCLWVRKFEVKYLGNQRR